MADRQCPGMGDRWAGRHIPAHLEGNLSCTSRVKSRKAGYSMVLAAEELRTPSSAVRFPKGGYTGKQAWLEEPKVKRASRNQTQGTMSTRAQPRRTVAPDTGQDSQ